MTLRRLRSSVLRVLGMLAVGMALLSTDASIARQLAVPALAPILLSAGWLCVAAAISHVARLLLFPGTDLIELGKRAAGEATGAGLVFLGICVVLAALLTSQARASTLPADAAAACEAGAGAAIDRARLCLPVLRAEVALWPDVASPWTIGAQVEAESAWKARAELVTAREHGAGLGQLTRVVRADGSVVFDRLADARRLHPSLAGWTWDERFDVRYQLRAVVLMDRAEWAAIAGAAGEDDRWSMVLAAYNGGRGGLARDRALCAGTAGCDAGRWFGHVERHSWRSKTTAAGYGRSFYDINRGYVRRVMLERRELYRGLWCSLA
jgi:hypothetical protein